jgi:hypothetical protein
MKTLVVMALVLGCTGLITAADAPASGTDRANTAVYKFETSMERDFSPIARSLDRWRSNRQRIAIKDMFEQMQKASPEDALYIAYQILALSPTHKAARKVFTTNKLPFPFDDRGKRAPDATVPACDNREVISKCASLSYPPFEVVREAIDMKSSTVSSYWKQQRTAMNELKATLLDILKQDGSQAPIVYPMLAYYHPEAKEVQSYYSAQGKSVPRQRIWFNPVDRYLLDHELAGIDCLSTPPVAGGVPPKSGNGSAITRDYSWTFPEYLRNCRIEAAVSAANNCSFSIADDHNRGVAISLLNGHDVRIDHVSGGAPQAITQKHIDRDLGNAPSIMKIEIRGRQITMAVDGVPVATAELPADYAYKKFTVVASNLVAQHLRVRYLSDNPMIIEEGEPVEPKKPVEPPAEPWLVERKTQLGKTLTFAFEDTSMDEVAAVLSRLTGAAFTIDASAEALKNVPITLAGTDMPLKAALEWVERMTDLTCEPTKNGFMLVWKK